MSTEQNEWLKTRLAWLQMPTPLRDNKDEREKWLVECGMPTADSRIEALVNALEALIGHHDDFEASSGNFEEAYYKLAKYARPSWDAARAALAAAKEAGR